MEYLIINAETKRIFLEATYSEPGCFFYSWPMFEDGKWIDSRMHNGFICVRRDLCSEHFGMAFHFTSVEIRNEFVRRLGTQDPISGVAITLAACLNA